MNAIPEIENKIFQKINYTEKYLQIRKRYIDNGIDTPIFKKIEILNVFKEIGENCKYITGGAYVINRKHQNYLFECSFVISKNSINQYIYIYIDDKIISNRVSNMGSILRYIPYNENLINQNFNLNSLCDLKNYINDIIALFNEYVSEYIKMNINE